MNTDFFFSESNPAVYPQPKLQLILRSYRLCKGAKMLEGRRKEEPFNWLLIVI